MPNNALIVNNESMENVITKKALYFGRMVILAVGRVLYAYQVGIIILNIKVKE